MNAPTARLRPLRRRIARVAAVLAASALVVTGLLAGGAGPAGTPAPAEAAVTTETAATTPWYLAGITEDRACSTAGVNCGILQAPWATSGGTNGLFVVGPQNFEDYGQTVIFLGRITLDEGTRFRQYVPADRAAGFEWEFRAARGTVAEFTIQNRSDQLCLGVGPTLGVRDSFACRGTSSGRWHLVPVVAQPGAYLLESADGPCLRTPTRVDLRIAPCAPSDPNFWWRPASSAQAALWADLAQSYALARCDAGAACDFVPEAGATDLRPVETRTCTVPAEVVRNGNDHPVAYTLQPASRPVGRAAAAIASTDGFRQIASSRYEQLAASYAARWLPEITHDRPLLADGTTTVEVAPRTVFWTYTVSASGHLPGRFTFFAGTDRAWSVDGTLDVPVVTPGGTFARVSNVASIDALDRASFDCRMDPPGATAADPDGGGGTGTGGSDVADGGSDSGSGAGGEPVDADATTVTVTPLADRASTAADPLALTVRVASAHVGVSGTVTMTLQDGDGRAVEVNRVALPASGRSAAYTTIEVPGDLAAGEYDLTIGFVPADPASFAASEAPIHVTVA